MKYPQVRAGEAMRVIHRGGEHIQAHCPDCEVVAQLDRDWHLLCCGRRFDGPVMRVFQPAGAKMKRKKPTKEGQRAILGRQEQRCHWCRREFGTFIIYRRRPLELTPVWDHIYPYAYTGRCNDEDFVASCRVCNGWKGSRMFDDVAECFAFLRAKWSRLLALEEGGYAQ